MYPLYDSTKIRNAVKSKMLLDLTIVKCLAEFNKSLLKVLETYMNCYDNFSDEEIELFGKVAVYTLSGYVLDKNGLEDTREYSETFIGRLDYDKKIKKDLLCELDTTKNYFDNFTNLFYSLLQQRIILFFENMTDENMRKYEMNDHQENKQHMFNALDYNFFGNESYSGDEEILKLKTFWIDRNIAAQIIQKAWRNKNILLQSICREA